MPRVLLSILSGYYNIAKYLIRNNFAMYDSPRITIKISSYNLVSYVK